MQLMKDCCQVTAPGVLFIAEAIVAPVEIAKYFGEDAVIDTVAMRAAAEAALAARA